MDIFKLILILGSLFLFSGCSTVHDEASKRYKPSKQVNVDFDKVNTILTAKTDEIYIKLKQLKNRGVGTNIQIDAERVNTSTEKQIKFIVKSKKMHFTPGSYEIVRERLVREELIVFNEIIESVVSAVNDLEHLGVKYKMQLTFTGSADGLAIKPAGIVYGGQWGFINFNKENTKVNGVPAAFNITLGEKVNNTQLAALRAISLADFCIKTVASISPEVKYDLRVHQNKGQDYRFASVIIELIK